jgi:chemotaxis protein CheX
MDGARHPRGLPDRRGRAHPPDADDVADAVGELVNVLGGNVQGLLLEESALGLPQVRTYDEPAPRRAAVEVCHAELVWAGHPVDVRVWLDEQDDTTPGDNS